MPSGKTHDRITLWSLPLVAALTFGHTRSSNLTLLVSGAFLFGGLMFGPDLDTYSRQFQRWGWFRWIWMPYQNGLNHRSFLSHGPLVGTAVRLIYLVAWIGFLAIPSLILSQLWAKDWTLEAAFLEMWRSLSIHYIEAIALFIGLDLGAISHTFSDLLVSSYKRFKTKGWVALIPQSIYKRFQSQGWSGLILPSTKKKKSRRKSSTSKLKARTKTRTKTKIKH